MKTIELSEATASVAEYAAQIDAEPVVFTVAGEPVAALVSIDDLDLESIYLGNNPEFLAIIAKSRADYEAHGGISAEEVRRRLNIPPRTDSSAGAKP